MWKSKFNGAFVLNHRVDLHAIDATPARWRGDAGSSPLVHPTHWLISTQVDGGIKATPETIGACAAAGANCFIAGSGLFAYDDMSQGVKELKAIAEEYQKK